MMNRVAHRGILFACLFAGVSVAQFKEVAPAPYTPAVARQQIRTLIGNAGPGNGQQTIDTLSGLLVWYRDIVDDELIAAWKGDDRANLPALVTSLADSRVASAIVEFSWHQQRPATFNVTYAPMLGDLMARYQGSAEPFLHDLLAPAVAGGQMPDLPKPVAEAVCRILLDMPDTGNWKKTALQILPHYRAAAQNLLVQDLHGNNQEKVYRAQFWLADLKLNVPGVTSDPQQPRRPMQPRSPVAGRPTILNQTTLNQSTSNQSTGNQPTSDALSQRPHIVEQPSASSRSSDGDGSLLPYRGPRSGILKCSGDPVLPNAEYVFPGMPLGNIQLDLDGKPWDARLVLGKGQTQDLILTNKSSSPQKRCTVRWSIIP
jgi:hypothetical protein